jgi:hypothetical protein
VADSDDAVADYLASLPDDRRAAFDNRPLPLADIGEIVATTDVASFVATAKAAR